MFIKTLTIDELMIFYYEKYLQASKKNQTVDADKYLLLAKKYMERIDS